MFENRWLCDSLNGSMWWYWIDRAPTPAAPELRRLSHAATDHLWDIPMHSPALEFRPVHLIPRLESQ